MGAEVLLYGYGLVCASMLVFNVVYSLHLRSDDRRRYKRMQKLRRRIDSQLRGIQRESAGAPQPVQVSHLTWMRRRLSHVNYLLAFDRLLDEWTERQAVLPSYIGQLQPVFLYLSTVYLRREAAQAAYYCHFLSRHHLCRHMEADQIQQVILSYLGRDSLYCKINALKALCSFGSPAVLVSALTELSRGENVQLHEKVVTEALLTYREDTPALIDLLLRQLERFSLPIQRAVLDYIRFKSGAYREPMEQILRDPEQNKELRFSAIRYFGRYPDERVRPLLLDFLREEDPLRWEYAAISASALAAYPGQDVVGGLLQAMHSPHWHVRRNASASLEAHGLTYEEMLQILAGEDRYAREMLTYQLEAKRREAQAAQERSQSVPEEVAVGV